MDADASDMFAGWLVGWFAERITMGVSSDSRRISISIFGMREW